MCTGFDGHGLGARRIGIGEGAQCHTGNLCCKSARVIGTHHTRSDQSNIHSHVRFPIQVDAFAI